MNNDKMSIIKYYRDLIKQNMYKEVLISGKLNKTENVTGLYWQLFKLYICRIKFVYYNSHIKCFLRLVLLSKGIKTLLEYRHYSTSFKIKHKYYEKEPVFLINTKNICKIH